MPRWSLTIDSNTVLLAAYLNQTIILRGHQNDLKDGIEILDRHAQFINSLGKVTWGTLTDLSRMNYQWRRDGNICHVRPMSPKISFAMPEGATSLMLNNSANDAWTTWQVRGSKGTVIEARSGEVVSLPEGFQGTVFIEAARKPAGEGSYARRSAPSAIVRRLLTEGRDQGDVLEMKVLKHRKAKLSVDRSCPEHRGRQHFKRNHASRHDCTMILCVMHEMRPDVIRYSIFEKA